MTGHLDGLITLGLSEADGDAVREARRNAFREPYWAAARTLPP